MLGSGRGVQRAGGTDRAGGRRGVRVEQHGRDVEGLDAVDERVVALGDEREAVALEPVDERELPQRLRAVQSLGEQPAREVLQLLLAARRRQAGVAQVVAQVEVRIVDPDRPALVERDVGEALAEARDEVQARLDQLAQLVVGRRRSVEDGDGRDVQTRPGLLEVQERRVECRDAVTVGDAVIVALPTTPVRSGRHCVQRSNGSDRASRHRRVLRRRRAAAPPGAARPARDRVGQRTARGRHDGVLRGPPLRRRLGDADRRARGVCARTRCSSRRTSTPTARPRPT